MLLLQTHHYKERVSVTVSARLSVQSGTVWLSVRSVSERPSVQSGTVWLSVRSVSERPSV